MSSTAETRIHFTCHHCGKELKADPTKIGKRARCKGCGKGMLVPGLSALPPKPTLEISDLPSNRPPLDEVDLDEELEAAAARHDASAGPASLYLGGANLVLFLALVMAAPFFQLIGKYGAIPLIISALGGLLLSWKGWRLAYAATLQSVETGQGAAYGLAGRWSHGLIALNYLAIAIVAGLLFYAEEKLLGGGKGALPGGINIENLLKPMVDANKEADKIINEINRR